MARVAGGVGLITAEIASPVRDSTQNLTDKPARFEMRIFDKGKAGVRAGSRIRQHAARLDVDLITRALQCRQADADPDFLFPERTKLPFQVEACATLLSETPPAC
jgi:hypothetical protein